MSDRDSDFSKLRAKVAGNAEALAVIDARLAAGASAGAVALELVNRGCFAGSDEAMLRNIYSESADLQAEFLTVEDWIGFKRAEASGRVTVDYSRL